ncbi:hypothetical protein ALQ96_101620 [Pseudomonas syringae pv. atrofaciens]|uniref:Uncharacterized protein n=1 Tax=Pseudomonas savastanoi pv. phaseolicola TaxID=319 RepID=A0A7Z6UNQ1_PSESH|nr:hypothetical protein ALO39_101628 [Pseudomonas syringae pv. lapsa]KPY73176.1 hypothetical protein ALO45_101584 [Pseudomonas syringae pv. syringae]RML31917.1 hypothetical protein ALQ96_101620 [Pseudomonas syringae pv. atrofaciens]RML60269.1 hypothetical protein ALQ92_101536 [Pseudomonas syringae pv. pisi]RMN63455.1 hypothetical protein ALQ54_101301 [Pseudomonas syringae]RMU82289.1 hypothetical protein ALP21_101585 [Pseudomonas savastanoi pv. phaseolicola]
MLAKINQHPVAFDFIHVLGNSVRHNAAYTIVVKKIIQAEQSVFGR